MPFSLNPLAARIKAMAELQRIAEDLGRAPGQREYDRLKTPGILSGRHLATLYGNKWANVCAAAGLGTPPILLAGQRRWKDEDEISRWIRKEIFRTRQILDEEMPLPMTKKREERVQRNGRWVLETTYELK